MSLLKYILTFLSLPFSLFLINYYPFTLSIPSILILYASLFFIFKNENIESDEITGFDVAYSGLFAFLITILGGVSRIFSTARNWDWTKHDAVLYDLANNSWPVIYSSTERGQDVLLYYFSYYLIPAGLQRPLGLDAHFLLIIETFLLFFALILAIKNMFGSRGYLFVLAAFLFVFPVFHIFPGKNLLTLSFIPTQHAIAILYTFAALVYTQESKTYGLGVMSVPVIFMLSPFVAIGLGVGVFLHWLISAEFKKVHVYLYGFAAFILIFVLYIWFGNSASSVTTEFIVRYDYAWIAALAAPFILVAYFVPKDFRVICFIGFSLAILCLHLTIGGSKDITRLLGCLSGLFLLYSVMSMERRYKKQSIAFYSYVAIACALGLYDFITASLKPFYSPTPYLNQSLSMVAPPSRIPFYQYISDSPSDWFKPDSLAKSLCGERKISLTDQNPITVIWPNAEPGRYRLTIEIELFNKNTGFYLFNSETKKPILTMIPRNLGLYGGLFRLKNGPVEVTFYFDNPQQGALILANSGKQKQDHFSISMTIKGLYKIN